jgi:hypothetical protein
VASGIDLSGLEITIGSKEYTEQLVLGSIMVQALGAAGADVVDQTGLTGTQVVRAAIESGDVLVGRLTLTDPCGNPRCAGVRPPDIQWVLAPEEATA